MTRRTLFPPALALTAALVLGACEGSSGEPTADAPSEAGATISWPRPTQTEERAEAAGLGLETVEHLDFHVHAHLDVFVDGQAVEVPAAIGIVIEDPAVKEFPSEFGTDYGGIDPAEGCANPCISPLHTHAADGVLHTESKVTSPNTLGQFFTEWDVALDAECVGDFCEPETTIEVFVDGEPYDGDPAAIELLDRREIAIVIGSPPPEVPSTFDFSSV
ncbi:MAG TPA: hypothetical protein VLA82_07985 [Actinomycetota bacterium]|nr:hypothetical protein [Actinomycetota bacterium]